MQLFLGDDCYNLPMDLEIVQSAVQTIFIEHAGPDDLHIDGFDLSFGDNDIQVFWCFSGTRGVGLVLAGDSVKEDLACLNDVIY